MKPVFMYILNRISEYFDSFWVSINKTGLLKAITETAIRCDMGGHQPQCCSTEFKTVVNIVFQHSSEFLIMLILLQHQEYNQLFVIEH